MKDFSVRVKVLLLAAIMLVITCIVAAVGIFSNHQSKQAADDMYNYNLMTTQYLNDATTQMRFIESDINYLLLTSYPPENKKILFDDLKGKTKTIQADMEKIKEIDKSERAQKALEALAYQTYDLARAMEADAGVTLRDLNVDGGASRNDFLMQFQADVLRASIRRPQNIETTSLGAAYLAGLASGFWSGTQDLLALRSSDDVFRPTMDEEDVAGLLAGWKDAIRRSM